jgi:hypothetical protein
MPTTATIVLLTRYAFSASHQSFVFSGTALTAFPFFTSWYLLKRRDVALHVKDFAAKIAAYQF